MRSTSISSLAGSRAVAAALCALCLVAAPAPAAAQARKKPAAGKKVGPKSLSDTLTGMAKAEYEAGKILYQDGDHANALVKFQHAFDVSSDARLLWNVAACEKNLRRYTRVLAAIGRYRKEGGALLTEQDQRDAEELEKTVRTLVSTLSVRVDEAGADVFVDDEKIGTSPLAAPVLVDVGARRIRVVKPGFKEFSRTEQVAGATEISIAAKLEKEIHEGRMIVEAGAKDAIAVDGKVVAVGRWEGVLASGGHVLKVTAPGKIAYQSEVVLKDNERRRVPITLEAQKGGVPAAALWGGGAGLVVVGAVITTVLLTRPSKVDATPGTIAPGVLPVGFGGFRFGGAR